MIKIIVSKVYAAHITAHVAAYAVALLCLMVFSDQVIAKNESLDILYDRETLEDAIILQKILLGSNNKYAPVTLLPYVGDDSSFQGLLTGVTIAKEAGYKKTQEKLYDYYLNNNLFVFQSPEVLFNFLQNEGIPSKMILSVVTSGEITNNSIKASIFSVKINKEDLPIIFINGKDHITSKEFSNETEMIDLIEH